MDLTAPAVLFPAISLLLLAYTNRFLALATLIRSLHDRHLANPDEMIVAQISNLRLRVILIRNMQACGVLSLLLCTICMFVLFFDQVLVAKVTFGISLLLMALSLAISVYEIQISVDALNLQLRSLEDCDPSQRKAE
ncbi:DUF2721 domain-containing protein [Blastopirellula sp. JC732]|uniref:DUF2721 domain-containing protein n=1 Tax=Blastopirellula sediminis TaxID=2894196 RepID=A0A9X1SKY1_9BACT|nr:DUF2721 domain-containing protein [Blastopirellula sediminis]MCC9606478.1 DUF2721 domain-containing protein [Blastopirellula sediminis]MCC9630224.1 DUF2721 domain-containing protein [Blastopirellula sediminis]